VLNESDLLIEEFFLRLRTREGIADIDKFKDILITNYELRITNFKKAELVDFDGKKLQLTDTGMDVSNSIITDLLEKI
jgi:coproporphyrinogen III oxidase-like Fe-S oxidoreductase